jgi:hypothetical protein
MKIPARKSVVGVQASGGFKSLILLLSRFGEWQGFFAEVVSCGTASDAHNFASPSSDGAVRCLKKILNDKRTDLSLASRRFND